jgi:flagellar L-ring protein precursor FlgH
MNASIRITTAVAALSLVVTVVGAAADSLYVPGKSHNMFADRKASAVGDVVTVLVTESTVATQDGNSQAKRSLDASASGGNGFFFNLLHIVPKASLGGSTKQDGSGSTSRSSKVVSTITVRVSEVTPSGQLMLVGERFIKTNADTQTIKFTGVVRPEDIGPDNTVPSGSVADARIEISGKGPIDRHVRPGFLSRIFQFLF